MQANFTCIACAVCFESSELQKAHFKTAWHQLNLKRNAASLPPLTLEAFEARQAQADKSKTSAAAFSGNCRACSKKFSSKKTYDQHVATRKHAEQVAKFERRSSEAGSVAAGPSDMTEMADNFDMPEPVFFQRLLSGDEEALTEEEQKEVKDLLRRIRVLDHIHECIFCSHMSSDFEKNLEHMRREHGFFIPDAEYCVDKESMIQYLGEKVSVAFVCLYCNTKGKRFQSLEAVRHHMVDKGHCKCCDDDGEEFEEFYDYSKDETQLAVAGEISFTEHGELTINGRHIGHRDLARYYKQKPVPEDTREEVVANQLATQYRHLQVGMTKKELDRQRQNLHVTRRQMKFRTAVGMRANNQKHFRDPSLQF